MVWISLFSTIFPSGIFSIVQMSLWLNIISTRFNHTPPQTDQDKNPKLERKTECLQLLQNDSLGVGSTTEGGALVGSAEGTLTVLLVGPTLSTTISLELTGGVKTTRLVVSYTGVLVSGWRTKSTGKWSHRAPPIDGWLGTGSK